MRHAERFDTLGGNDDVDDERLVLALVAALFHLLLCQLGEAEQPGYMLTCAWNLNGFGHVEVDQSLKCLSSMKL